MTNEDLFEDIKQLIDAKFAQQDKRNDERFTRIDEKFARIDEKFARIDENFTHIDKRFTRIEDKIDTLSGSVREAIDTSNDANGAEIVELKRRVARLEQAAA